VQSLYELSRADIAGVLAAWGEPEYRASQLWSWVYRRLVGSFDQITPLPAALRSRLADTYSLDTLAIVRQDTSAESQAVKSLLRLGDGRLIESVLMHYDDESEVAGGSRRAGGGARQTLCLSTQAGCAMGCVFCATGQMGLVRDLTAGECIGQVVLAARALASTGKRLTNVVFMGMGEPLANWPATWATVEALHDPDGLNLGARRLTISTVGLVPGIRRLANAGLPVRLAVSLHGPDDELRTALVPVNLVHPLGAVLAACDEYRQRTGRRITFEYVLIRGVNDSRSQARALAKLVATLKPHVNLIPLNPTEGSPLAPSSYAQAVAFQEVLRASGLSVTLRQRRGIEIRAGCGQLRSREAEGRLGRSLAPSPALVGR
jgi:23S rRNA (adenine2503-C2)-methyltransferase